MKRGFVVAVGGAAIVIAGLSGCSSGEKKSESSGSSTASSAPGTASVSATAAPSGGGTKVTIDGQDQNVAGTVVCSAMGGNMNIAIGDAATGIAAVRQRGRLHRPVGWPRQRQRRDAGLPDRHGPGRSQGHKGRQHLQDLGHRDRCRHGQPHAAGEQAVRDRRHLPVARHSKFDAAAASRQGRRRCRETRASSQAGKV